MANDFQSVASFLKEQDDFVLISHASPDGDTVGSVCALALLLEQLGKRVTRYCPELIPERLQFILQGASFTQVLPEQGCFVTVDVASPSMLRGLENADRMYDLAIDHHIVHTVRAKMELVCAEYPANGEIIAELVPYLGCKLDRTVALPLYAAISSDSGGFRFSATRPQTHRIAAELLETGIDFAKINRLLFETKTPGQLALEQYAYNHLHLYCGGKVAVVTLTQEALTQNGVKSDDVDAINQIPRQIIGVEVSLVLRPKNDEIKASLRSNDYYDVAALAAKHGGGGHTHAAGCSFSTTLEQALDSLLADLKRDFDGTERNSFTQ